MKYSRVGLIGTGAVGRALSRALVQAGFKLTVLLDKNAGLARQIAEELRVQQSGSDISLIPPDAEFLIVSVPDAEIAKVDRSLRSVIFKLKLQACVHTSGALPGSMLESVSSAGISVGSFHPLQTFPAKGPSPTFSGIIFTLEGDFRAVELMKDLVVQLGGSPVVIASEGKATYHTAAVFASNFLPVILRESLDLLASIGIEREQARKMLTPLMRQSLENCLKLGEVAALTGPITRGDALTVQKHIETLQSRGSSTVALYRMLSIKALELALEKGLNDESFEEIKRALRI